MNILGLHFGHDAGIALIADGFPVNNLIRERHNRAKHAFGINVSDIEKTLADANLRVEDLDMIAVTSTQCYELVVVDRPCDLEIKYEPHPELNIKSTFYDFIKKENIALDDYLDANIIEYVFSDDEAYDYYRNLLPEYTKIKKEELGVVKSLKDFINLSIWDKVMGLSNLAEFNAKAIVDSEEVRKGFHYPITVTLMGRAFPAVIVQHHAAHAASAFYTSKSRTAAVVTHDGAFYKVGPNNGMIFYGEDHKLCPIIPNHLAIGDLYDRVGAYLGFDLFGAAGKLMGLAPYGKPIFFQRKMVGNTYDMMKNGIKNPVDDWMIHCYKMAKEKDYDMTGLGNVERVLDPVCVDIAASTQKLFEETILYTMETVASMFSLSGLQTNALCFSGGTGLNCPSNSRLTKESPFKNIYIPPNCDDSGLSLGAAQYLYHNVLDNPRVELSNSQYRKLPFLGMAYSAAEVKSAINAVEDKVNVEYLPEAAKKAAEDLHVDKIVAWYEGRSEIGPRALGHRSLLMNPKYAANWERMNTLKNREKWRPFAPSVLAEDAALYFRGMPEESPFMLFTAQVCTADLPAITHIDGSARVQTVTPEVGGLYDILTYLKELSGSSVVLNTSFNGPREPIVERPEEAIQFLLTTNLDVLYLEGHRLTRK
jgi:carbamoyltransferase